MENLGKKARDMVTGFEGTIVGITIYLFGCNCYGLAPKVGKDGKLGETMWFDEGRIDITGEGIEPSSVRVEKPGGDNLRGPNKRMR